MVLKKKEQLRAHEIEDIKRQHACEARDAEQKCTIKDMDIAVYTKNFKIKQMREHIRVDARMMQGNDYQKRCRDELDVTHLQQEQTHDLYERPSFFN